MTGPPLCLEPEGVVRQENRERNPGADYVGGWRDAKDVGAELLAALSAAWPDAERLRAVAHSAANGSGMVQLRIPAEVARALAELVRAASADSSRRAAS